MADNDKTNIFRGQRNVSNLPSSSSTVTNNQEQLKSSRLFPTFNFGQINETLKNISNTHNNIKPSVDINNNNDIEYDDKPETSISMDKLSLLNKHTHLRDINYSLILEDDGTNPQSPLHSVKTFEELKLEPQLLNGIYYMGFRRPSRIQERALPQLLAYPPRNMIAQSQNGTGKTAAFSLATLSRMDPNLNYVQALILSPTFELALQIGQVIENMAKFLPHIKIAYAVRDPTISKRNEYTKGKELNVPIVIGTPGTVEDWCRKMKIIDLKKLRMFVIDEADVMISLPGFSQICIDLVKNTIGKDCQTMLFSATYSDEVMDFAKRIIENPVVFRLKREEQSLSNIRQFYIECNNDEEKYDAVKTIYSSITIGQAMIFCRYKRTAHALALRMINDKHCVELLSSELTVEQRAAIINRFRNGKFRVLVVTNVCARGIDIDDISLVINFEFPLVYDDKKHCFIDKPDYDTYLHRIGRAGRFGRIGHTFNLITPSEKHLLKQIENYFQKPIVKFSEKFIADDELYNI
ncbi:unnamed protein product [Rotaria sp. Silwood2]|nr:unnamed protein product [Rotaria sp. Silwood2]CAF2735715.1 unnamed protein product [Rotaria sp. Silwood2]CAF2978811.1 unnamed protein product [Rotaria sp. Silwood2]CAF3165805.1 unnamed protein product [Rotaria sp. Silwood2]CAF3973588.1 unnamed protein product [Rotaria sp. Silwood2]